MTSDRAESFRRRAAQHAASARRYQRNADIDLMDSWRAAARLHAHGDQSYLAANAFATDWATAQAFIAAMLEIYNRDNLTTGGPL